jgi:hypothetical protein
MIALESSLGDAPADFEITEETPGFESLSLYLSTLDKVKDKEEIRRIRRKAWINTRIDKMVPKAMG